MGTLTAPRPSSPLPERGFESCQHAVLVRFTVLEERWQPKYVITELIAWTPIAQRELQHEDLGEIIRRVFSSIASIVDRLLCKRSLLQCYSGIACQGHG